MEPFDLLNSPVSGTNLIEADAGTGKTYTIAGLFVRLILERQIPIEKILVVTFTTAATDELKDRIRQKLFQAKTALLSGAAGDQVVDGIVKRISNPSVALQCVQRSLIDFDRACIFTIHGFCNRVLHEHAFETGNLFDTKLVNAPEWIIQKAADDFWRKHFYYAPLEFISYALYSRRIPGPDYFFRLVERFKHPDIRIIPNIEDKPLESLATFRECFRQLRCAWPKARDTVEQLLMDPRLKDTAYGSLKTSQRKHKVLALIEAMDRFVDSKSIGFPVFKDFKKFTSSGLRQFVKKNHLPPIHEIFELCEELQVQGDFLAAEIDRRLLHYKVSSFEFINKAMIEQKKINNVHFFEDLLVSVKQALEGDDGNRLVQTIRQRYKVALVDEFQDTDSIQYDILSKLFSSDKQMLFMIGDPKQAIYGFRGADIFSYFKAVRQAENKYTLKKNWRSNIHLITAINTVFSGAEKPFVFEEISFENALPANSDSPDDTGGKPAFILWYLDSKNGRRVSKTEASHAISKHVAEEIAAVLSDGSAAVLPEEIAVLVRTNRQAQLVKTYLSQFQIPSVLFHTGNIFDSTEAQELERFLASVLEPNNERKFRAALATDLLGAPGEELQSLETHPEKWEVRRARFREYHQIWSQHGFIHMFHMFMVRENVKQRLLSLPGGERRLTNILHLEELLHATAIDRKLHMAGLLKWLSEQRDPKSPRLEEHQLRLESDAHAVNIITIHKSKGLEFRIVFCPFCWEGLDSRADELIFHPSSESRKPTLDLGSEEREQHEILAQNERLAESLRLVYVAVTRAKQRCYLAWGNIKNTETSALAYLFHSQGMNPSEGIVSCLKNHVSSRQKDELIADLSLLAKKSQGTVDIVFLPEDSKQQPISRKRDSRTLLCRHFSGNIDSSWKISSYSSMISSGFQDIDFPDRDGMGPERESPGRLPEENTIFSFPKGTRAGLFFHDIFQSLNFNCSAQDRRALITKKLQAYGFGNLWLDIVDETISNILCVPILGDLKGFRLSVLTEAERINEMEFYFPLRVMTPQTLQGIFKDYTGIGLRSDFPHRLGRLLFAPARGFMKGYIDMVFLNHGRFYLLDWKSNYLGPQTEDYHNRILHKVMKEDFYTLQYHLYTLALHRYLKLRVKGYRYEEHFGGVIYVFIRGVSPEGNPEFGIFRDLPPPEIIDAMDDVLIGA